MCVSRGYNDFVDQPLHEEWLAHREDSGEDSRWIDNNDSTEYLWVNLLCCVIDLPTQ